MGLKLSPKTKLILIQQKINLGVAKILRDSASCKIKMTRGENEYGKSCLWGKFRAISRQLSRVAIFLYNECKIKQLQWVSSLLKKSEKGDLRTLKFFNPATPVIIVMENWVVVMSELWRIPGDFALSPDRICVPLLTGCFKIFAPVPRAQENLFQRAFAPCHHNVSNSKRVNINTGADFLLCLFRVTLSLFLGSQFASQSLEMEKS